MMPLSQTPAGIGSPSNRQPGPGVPKIKCHPSNYVDLDSAVASAGVPIDGMKRTSRVMSAALFCPVVFRARPQRIKAQARAVGCVHPRERPRQSASRSSQLGSYHENFKFLRRVVPSEKVGRLVGRKEKLASISAEKFGARLASPQPRPAIAGQWGRGDNRLRG